MTTGEGGAKPGRMAYALVLPTWLTLGVFFLLPLTILFVISFGQRATYGGLKPIEDLGLYVLSGKFLANYARSFHPIYLQIFWRSIWMAVVTTGLCLAISYPVAYYIAVVAPARRRNLLLGLVVIPFWTSFLIRTYAWMFILRTEGLVNRVLMGDRPHLAAARAPVQRLLRAARPRLRRAPVHDPAALRLAREARPVAARSLGRPRGAAARDPLARHRPHDDAG